VTLTETMLVRQKRIYGRYPLKAALDGGFASKDNLKAAKAMGIKDVCFAKKRGLETEEMLPQPVCLQAASAFPGRHRGGHLLARARLRSGPVHPEGMAIVQELCPGSTHSRVP
jgi:hypothetical protein